MKIDEIIKKLEKLKSIVSYLTMVDIILTWSGFKPATLIELSCFSDGSSSKKTFLEKVKQLENILNELKLAYKININYPSNRNEVTQYSIVANNKNEVEKLIIADLEKNEVERRLKMGILLGYPKTAVMAFSNGKSIENNILPKEILNSEELKFLHFRLSKNWKKEIKYLKEKANAIKKIAPNLYKKIIKK